MKKRRDGLGRGLLVGQGAFWAASGLWPLVHLPSFLRVTGPKTDLWLVKTVGTLITVMGGVMLAAGLRGRPRLEDALLAAGGALALALVDVNYVAKRRISPVYLLDAVTEGALIGAWTLARPSLR